MLDDISVVIPVHPSRIKNGMLRRAVDSVKAQTYPAAEIIVSKDQTKQGAAATRQEGLEQVKTKWVAFLDSDDEMMPRHLEVLLKCALENNAEYVFSWYQIKGGKDPFPAGHFGPPWDPNNPRQTTITILVKTALAKRVGFIHNDKTKGEDFAFTLGCNNLGARIIHLPERTWIWHHHGWNTSGRPDKGDAR